MTSVKVAVDAGCPACHRPEEGKGSEELPHSAQLRQQIPQAGQLRQQEFIPSSSGGGKSNKLPADLVSGEVPPSPGSQKASSHCVLTHWGPFHKGTNPTDEGSTFMT